MATAEVLRMTSPEPQQEVMLRAGRDASPHPTPSRPDGHETLGFEAGARGVAAAQVSEHNQDLNGAPQGPNNEPAIEAPKKSRGQAGRQGTPKNDAPLPIGKQTFADPTHKSDMGNSRLFAELHSSRLRYVLDLDTWLAWDGTRWRTLHNPEVVHAAKAAVAERRKRAETLPNKGARASGGSPRSRELEHACRSESNARLKACVELARSEPEMVTHVANLDTDPYRIAVLNGEIDLRTGILHPHNPASYITRLVPIAFDPGAPCERWLKFTNDVFLGEEELIGYIQRACGCGLTGRTGEQKFFILHNSGANGKSTFINIYRAVAGEYAKAIDVEVLLTQRRNPSAPNPELAALRGARLVTATEPEAGARLSESFIKLITGGDPITCRDLYSPPFTFHPRFKLWLSCNHKPGIRGADHGIWRRPQLIPFDATFKDVIEEQDDKLRVKRRNLKMEEEIIANELPGVLAWMVRGAADFCEEGLGSCARVTAATNEFRVESDTFGRFLDEMTVAAPSGIVEATRLYQTYSTWAHDSGEFVLSKTAFGRAMSERKFDRSREMGARQYIGLTLRSELQPVH